MWTTFLGFAKKNPDCGKISRAYAVLLRSFAGGLMPRSMEAEPCCRILRAFDARAKALNLLPFCRVDEMAPGSIVTLGTTIKVPAAQTSQRTPHMEADVSGRLDMGAIWGNS